MPLILNELWIFSAEVRRGYLKTFLERAEEVKFGGDLPSQESCQQAQQIVESVLVTPT